MTPHATDYIVGTVLVLGAGLMVLPRVLVWIILCGVERWFDIEPADYALNEDDETWGPLDTLAFHEARRVDWDHWEDELGGAR